MQIKNLKMTTAIVASLSIGFPAPVLAQNSSELFPCQAPDGTEVESAAALSAAMVEFLQSDASDADLGNCDATALELAFEQDDGSLMAAFAAAPTATRDQLIAMNPDLANVGGAQVGVVEDAPAGEEAEAAAVEPEVTADPDADTAMTDAETAPEGAAEMQDEVAESAPVETAPEADADLATDTGAATTDAESGDQAAQTADAPLQETDNAEMGTADAEAATDTQEDVVEDDLAETAPETEAEAGSESDVAQTTEENATDDVVEGELPQIATTPEAEGESGSDVTLTDDENATDDVVEGELPQIATTPEAEGESGSDMTLTDDENATDEVTEGELPQIATTPETEETAEIDIAEATDGAGEAGGEQLSDEERQELIAEREAETESVAPAAASAAEDDSMAEEAEVETQVIAEDDVRSSSEDFTTAAVGDSRASESSDDEGLSNFEKALLLGLGAAVVGSVLNNGDEVVSNSGDRVVVQRDGELRVLKNDDELLRRPGAEVQTQTFQDGSTRTVLSYEDGSQITTVRASNGTVLRRTLIQPEDGSEIVLFDDTQAVEPIAFDELPEPVSRQDRQAVDTSDRDALRSALEAASAADLNRQFSLQQVRNFKRLRDLAPEVELDQITFASGSAAIEPAQAEDLRALGISMIEIIEDNPRAVFLVEGHTDAVGNAGYNLSLSDRRAESVALALTEYFGVPPQNLITQGYGETDLKIPVLTDERANRRAAVRNITGLLSRS